MSGRIRSAAATGHYPRSFAVPKDHAWFSDDKSLERVASLAGLSKFHFALKDVRDLSDTAHNRSRSILSKTSFGIRIPHYGHRLQDGLLGYFHL